MEAAGRNQMLRYAGRPTEAAPATGSAKVHARETATLVSAALGLR